MMNGKGSFISGMLDTALGAIEGYTQAKLFMQQAKTEQDHLAAAQELERWKVQIQALQSERDFALRERQFEETSQQTRELREQNRLEAEKQRQHQLALQAEDLRGKKEIQESFQAFEDIKGEKEREFKQEESAKERSFEKELFGIKLEADRQIEILKMRGVHLPEETRKLRNEFLNQSKEFIEMTNAYQRLIEISPGTAPFSGIKDDSLIRIYHRMHDPGSVIKESEVAGTIEVVGLWDQMIAKYTRAADGTFLSGGHLRKDLITAVGQMYQAAVTQHEQRKSYYRHLAGEFSPEVIVPLGAVKRKTLEELYNE